MHVGATLKPCGGIGRPAVLVLQQIWPLQSLSTLHAFGQVEPQVPLQQIAAVDGQSAEVWQDFGQLS